MHKIEFHLKGRVRRLSCTDSWDNMSKRELLIWCGILRMDLTRKEAFDMAVYHFYRIPKKLFVSLNDVLKLQLRATLSFLEKNELTANVLGHVRILGRKYHGPANKLANLTISEWRRTELYYDLWQKSGQTKFLLLLAATLFRSASNKSGDDVRSELSEKTIARRASLYRWAMHPNVLKAIQLFYEGSRTYVQRKFPTVYQSSGSNDPFAKKGKSLMDWEDNILAYSGDKLGNYVQTSETNLYLFLKHMTERIKEYERLTTKK